MSNMYTATYCTGVAEAKDSAAVKNSVPQSVVKNTYFQATVIFFPEFLSDVSFLLCFRTGSVSSISENTVGRLYINSDNWA